MATPAHSLIQDPDINLVSNGPTPGGKTDVAKAPKKGGNASNSRNPSVLHSVEKESCVNVKKNLSKAPYKGEVDALKVRRYHYHSPEVCRKAREKAQQLEMERIVESFLVSISPSETSIDYPFSTDTLDSLLEELVAETSDEEK